MSLSNPLLEIRQPCETAIDWAIGQLAGAGLQVIRTFDLQKARLTLTDCTCPYHGTRPCDCQMVVLLVYGRESQPTSLVAHSYAGCTWFYLAQSPQLDGDAPLETTIRDKLCETVLPPGG